jgi:hypothetical protein
MIAPLADNDGPDWPLLQNGAVTLFFKPEVLEATCYELSRIGYEVARVRCREGTGKTLEDLSAALKWTAQFGGRRPSADNFPALRDGFRSFPFAPHNRAALAFDGFDQLLSNDPTFAIKMLDIIESTARDHLLVGCVLLGLVQTDDADFQCPSIGCRVPAWNPAEWLAQVRK